MQNYILPVNSNHLIFPSTICHSVRSTFFFSWRVRIANDSLSHDCINIDDDGGGVMPWVKRKYGHLWGKAKIASKNFPSYARTHFQRRRPPQRFMIPFPDDVIICVANIIELSHAQAHTHTDRFSAPKHSITKPDSHLWPSRKKMKLNEKNVPAEWNTEKVPSTNNTSCNGLYIFFSHRQPKARPVLSALPSLFHPFSFASLSKHIETKCFDEFLFHFIHSNSFVSSLEQVNSHFESYMRAHMHVANVPTNHTWNEREREKITTTKIISICAAD